MKAETLSYLITTSSDMNLFRLVFVCIYWPIMAYLPNYLTPRNRSPIKMCRIGIEEQWEYNISHPKRDKDINTGCYLMPFVFVLICDAWEICFILCKQRDRVYSCPFLCIKWSISPMHCIIKTHRQKAWDDGVAPSVNIIKS